MSFGAVNSCTRSRLPEVDRLLVQLNMVQLNAVPGDDRVLVQLIAVPEVDRLLVQLNMVQLKAVPGDDRVLVQLIAVPEVDYQKSIDFWYNLIWYSLMLSQ